MRILNSRGTTGTGINCSPAQSRLSVSVDIRVLASFDGSMNIRDREKKETLVSLGATFNLAPNPAVFFFIS